VWTVVSVSNVTSFHPTWAASQTRCCNLPAHLQQVLGDHQMQRRQKPPKRTWHRQLPYFQNAGEHGFPLQELQMVPSGKTHVQRQDHPQHKPEPRRGGREPLDGHMLFDPFLESQLFRMLATGSKPPKRSYSNP
jgi:hypothetical protein